MLRAATCNIPKVVRQEALGPDPGPAHGLSSLPRSPPTHSMREAHIPRATNCIRYLCQLSPVGRGADKSTVSYMRVDPCMTCSSSEWSS